ncbi:MAG: iron-sulfur cluster assembly scaffold protein [Clostridia bacterium]|nr:iron-sulfur cluster assembly scaffold protein [Clostridia bacterium]
MYNQKVMEILQNPQNVGMLRGANAIGRADSDACSDIVKFYLNIEDGKVVEAKFKTFGGATLIAVCSITTQMILGMTVEELLQFNINNVLSELGQLAPQKDYCLNLSSQALVNAVEDYYKRLEREAKKNNNE